MFSIVFLDDEVPEPRLAKNEKAVFASISANDLQEKIIAPINYWSEVQYQKQWADAIEKLLSGQRERVGLLTEMYDPDSAPFPVMIWSLYKVGNDICMQNYYQSLQQLSKDFNFDDIYGLIHERETVTEDGGEISEWKIDTKDLESFVLGLKAATKNKQLDSRYEI